MSQLSILTFTNKDLGNNLLVRSCAKHKLNLEIVQTQSWEVNALKIKFLYEYLQNKPGDHTYMVVDAFDVYLNGGEGEILAAFDQQKVEIVFSAEANFYFRNNELRNTYHRIYPKSDTIYQYLNSGTFIGSGANILKMLSSIINDYNLDLNNIESFVAPRSDQYLYARHFVEHSQIDKTGYRIGLDYNHQLFEVTGGRMHVINLPFVSKLHAYNGYKIERFLLKLFRLNQHQDTLSDIRYNPSKEQFTNKITRTHPLVIHVPGSWKSFDEIMKRLLEGQKNVSFKKLPAVLLSLIGFLVSAFVPTKIKL